MNNKLTKTIFIALLCISVAGLAAADSTNQYYDEEIDVPEQDREGADMIFNAGSRTEGFSQATDIEGGLTLAPDHARLYEVTVRNVDDKYFTPENTVVGVYNFRARGFIEGEAYGEYTQIFRNNWAVTWDGREPGLQPIQDTSRLVESGTGPIFDLFRSRAEDVAAYRSYDSYVMPGEAVGDKEPLPACDNLGQAALPGSNCYPVENVGSDIADKLSQTFTGTPAAYWAGYTRMPVEPLAPRQCSQFDQGTTSHDACQELPSERSQDFWLYVTEEAEVTQAANFEYCDRRTIYSVLGDSEQAASEYQDRCSGDIDLLVTVERPTHEGILELRRDSEILQAGTLKVRVIDAQIELMIRAIQLAFLGASAALGYTTGRRRFGG